MFTLTTYKESAFMGIHDKKDKTIVSRENKITVKRKEPAKEHAFIECYIHGKAQDLAGYDIPVYLDGEINLNSPEQPCKLLLEEKHDCILIQWSTSRTIEIIGEETKRVYKGLICLKEDKESLDYAREHQKKHSKFL